MTLRTDIAETRISTSVGDIVLQIPWMCTVNDLYLIEEMLMNQVKYVRAQAEKRNLRHEQWLRERHLAP